MLVFDMHDLNRVLFLSTAYFSALPFSFAAVAKRFHYPHYLPLLPTRISSLSFHTSLQISLLFDHPLMVVWLVVFHHLITNE